MIVRTARGAELRVQAGDWPSMSTVWPVPTMGLQSSSGFPVTQDAAFGVPAVSMVIRQPASLIAALPFVIYRKGDTRSRADDSDQFQLLHELPWPDVSPFQLFFDIALSLEAVQNAFVLKAKTGGKNPKVVGLTVLDPQRIQVRRDQSTGAKVFDYYVDPGQTRYGLTTETILHIRGQTPTPGALSGTSLIQLHRNPIGAAIAMQNFSGDYFKNNAQAPMFFTGAANQQQAKDILDLYNSDHQGSGNQWRAGALWGATDVKSVPLSSADSMFVNQSRLSIEDACRIWQWPHHLSEISGEPPLRNEDMWTALFMKIYMFHRLRRIESALNTDPDLFPDTTLYGEFDTAEVERSDFGTRMAANKNAIQGGIFTPNEIRARENLPPVDGGDKIQFPLVGGGPVDGGGGGDGQDGAAGGDAQPRSLNGHHDADERVAELLSQ